MTRRQINFRYYWEWQNRMVEWDELKHEHEDLVWALSGGKLAQCSPLMQSTGIMDRNGKEIYESDIVIVRNPLVETIPDYKALVEWDKYRFALKNLDYEKLKENRQVFPLWNLDPFGLDLEIIGNMYENVELLDLFKTR